MRFNTFCLFFLLFCVVHTDSVWAQLSAAKVVEQVLQKNPSLQDARFRVEQARGALTEVHGAFNTVYSSKVNRYYNATPLNFYSPLISDKVNGFDYSVDATKKFSWGMILTPSIGVTGTDAPEYFPSYGNSILSRGTGSVQITQPVLSGGGTKYTTARLQIARNELEKAKCQYTFQASSVMLNALQTYLEYIAALQSLDIQKVTEGSMRKAFTEVTHMVELDALPASELLVIKANLANQVANRLLAENACVSNRNTLGALMGMTEADLIQLEKPDSSFPAKSNNIPSDSLAYQTFWCNKSLSNRTDLQVSKLDIASAELDLYLGKKNIAPKINLLGSAGYNGIYGGSSWAYTQPLYQHIPGMNYSIGMSVNFGGKNEAYKGQLMQSRAALDRLQQSNSLLELDIRNQVKNSFYRYLFANEIVGYLSESVAAYSKAYANETRKFQAGTSTTLNVVAMQRNYLEAKNQLVQQQLNMNSAVLEFRHQTGTLVLLQGDSPVIADPAGLFSLPELK